MELSKEEKERYSRHLRIPGFGEDVQLKLRNSSILVIGVGGLGSPALLYLAAAGVGRLGIADFDRIERHNLQRQILFSDDDVGLPKVEVAKKRLQALNPYTEIVLHEEGINPANARDVLSRYDVIVDGSDNFDTRYLVNDASFFEKKPLVYGSVFRMEGQVMVLNDQATTPCYRCLFPEPPEPGTVPNCNEAGVVGALCGVVGSLQAMEAIKLISGVGEVTSGRLLKVDVFNSRFPCIELVKDPDCPLCSLNAKIKSLDSQNYAVPCALPDVVVEDSISLDMEIDIYEVKRLLSTDKIHLLDVREPAEVAVCQISDSLFIPMGSIPERINDIPRNKPVVVYCHHGMRSMRVAHYLRGAGFENCASMKGGIHQWAITHDSSMGKY